MTAAPPQEHQEGKQPYEKSANRFQCVDRLLCISAGSLCRAGSAARPVTPDAAPEAVELLNFIYRISGKHTLSGQHNFPADKDKQTVAACQGLGQDAGHFRKGLGFRQRRRQGFGLRPE